MIKRHQIRKIATLRNLTAAASFAALAGIAWLYRRQKVPVSEAVKAQLPIAKNLQTIPDKDAHYDLDGVSFDSEGVVVSSGHYQH